MKKLAAIAILSYLAYLVFTTSCANPGMPTGGEKDTIPPVVLRTIPEMKTTNYQGNSVSLTFNEYIISDEVGTKLLVSPPLPKKPVVRTKSKTLTIELGDSLRQNVTYSLDFRDAIADNNEKNLLKDFRFAFSTGPDFDSLMVGGYVLDAFNMEPVEGATVLLYDQSDSISSFRNKIPKYIAQSDEEGFYTVTNVGPGKYHLFALEDADGSMTYNQEGERLAFLDSLVVPLFPEVSAQIDLDSLHFKQKADSLRTGADTLSVREAEPSGKKMADPGMIIPSGFDTDTVKPGRQANLTSLAPHYLLLFEEISRDNFLDNYARDQRDMIRLYFSNSLADSFAVKLISPQPSRPDWAYTEFSSRRDTVNIWINDTIVSRNDTINLVVRYQTLDSLRRTMIKPDTLELTFKDPVRREKKKKDKENVPLVRNFSLRVSGGDSFDPFDTLFVESPGPLESFDFSKIHITQKVDTLEQPVEFSVEQDSVKNRKFLIFHPWQYEAAYRLTIDSAAARTFSGTVSEKTEKALKTQKEDYYGEIRLNITNVPGNCIVQLLKNTEKEEVLKQAVINKNSLVGFPLIKPEKYKIKLIADRNENGKWDTGNLGKGILPERVVYYHKIIKIRSNFRQDENWVLPADLQQRKELIDEEQDAKDKKSKKGEKSQKAPRGRNSL